jgi:hypothetical protein
VIYSRGYEVLWLENVGSGRFGSPRTLIAEPEAYSYEIGSGDLDGDGDTDLVTMRALPDSPPSPDLLLWLENESNDCDGNGSPDVCEPDCDGDGLIDACDPVTPDGDADGVCDAQDCAPADADVWSPSSPARSLVLERTGGTVLLSWQPPIDPGGTETRYDLLCALAPDDFVNDTSCLESDELDLQAEDGEDPPPAGVLHYLVRAESGCPEEPGNLGTASDGTPRSGIACP